MKRIPLTQGLFALVDDTDYEALAEHAWYAAKHRQTYYAQRTDYSGGVKRTIKMHRLLVGAEIGDQVDHQDGNGLNNQRGNIRFCSSQQNAMNRRLNNKGVRLRSDRPNSTKPWLARIMVDRKPKFLGCFETKALAEQAYQDASRQYFGEFAPSD